MAKHKWLSCLISATLLIGCGGDDSSPPSKETDTILAPVVQNNFTQLVLSDGTTHVSLADNVTDPQGLPVTLESVVSLTDACDDPEFDSEAMTFEVAKENQDTCYFEYTVKNHASNTEWDKSATADSYVLVSETAQSATLPPISQYTVVNQNLVIDLEEQLAGYYPAGYILDQDVVVLGSGNATPDSTNNTISYMSPNKGVSRILYSLTSNDGLDTMAGYIDVAVSAEGNNMPVAEDFEGPENIMSGVKVTVDVSDHISDPDGDALQLTDAYAFNADAIATDQDSLTNTSFDFTASGPGTYDVSYYVTDHRGGYAVAVVRITVEHDTPWDDIILSNNEVYTAPWEKEGADGFNIPYQTVAPETIDGTDYEITLFNHEQAESVCLSRGMLLPSPSQLQELYSERGNVQDSDSWPVVENYWSDEPTVSVNLASGGTSTTEVDTTPLIATCVYPGELNVEVTRDNAYTSQNSDDDEYNTVQATVTQSDGTPKEGATVYMYSAGNLVIDGTVKTTGVDGTADFNIRSDTTGEFETFVRYFSQELPATITFILNEIVDLVIEGDDRVSIGESTNLEAYATYTNGERDNVTDDPSTAWGVDDPMLANVSETGVLTGLALGTVQVSAIFSGESDTHAVEIIDGWGDSGRLDITPPHSEIEVGQTVTYTATAYSAGYPAGRDVTAETQFDITTGDTLGTLTGNVFRAEQEGSVAISADYQLENGESEFDDATITISSSAPILELITVTGPDSVIEVGADTQLTATASYSDGSEPDVSNASDWTSSNNAVATVSPNGLVTGVAEGTANITAEYQGETDSKTITVNAAPPLLEKVEVTGPSTAEVGEQLNYTAMAYYEGDTNGTDVTGEAQWMSSAPSVASANDGGAVEALSEGSTDITATYLGEPGSVELNVSEPSTLEDRGIEVDIDRTRVPIEYQVYEDGEFVTFSRPEEEPIVLSGNAEIELLGESWVLNPLAGGQVIEVAITGNHNDVVNTYNVSQYEAGTDLMFRTHIEHVYPGSVPDSDPAEGKRYDFVLVTEDWYIDNRFCSRIAFESDVSDTWYLCDAYDGDDMLYKAINAYTPAGLSTLIDTGFFLILSEGQEARKQYEDIVVEGPVTQSEDAFICTGVGKVDITMSNPLPRAEPGTPPTQSLNTYCF
ncbi:Ig-like domain-containing protein [Vibrio owensii]